MHLHQTRLLFSLFFVAACLAVACGHDTIENKPPSPAANNRSLYQLEHRFHDQTGRECTLAEHRGRRVLIAMVFTHCSYACPALVGDLKGVLSAAGEPTELDVVLVSMDHKRDLPPTLAVFAKEHDLAPARYSLLHGDADAVAELAAVLGVRYAEVEGGDFSHSNRITLLDRDGNIVHQHDGLGENSAALVAAITAAQ